MGGQVAAPSNEEENRNLLEMVKPYPQCFHYKKRVVWMGVVKNVNHTDWTLVGKNNADNKTMLNNLDKNS